VAGKGRALDAAGGVRPGPETGADADRVAALQSTFRPSLASVDFGIPAYTSNVLPSWARLTFMRVWPWMDFT
jgi:hypothetical protein